MNLKKGRTSLRALVHPPLVKSDLKRTATITFRRLLENIFASSDINYFIGIFVLQRTTIDIELSPVDKLSLIHKVHFLSFIEVDKEVFLTY